jgi:hypothetical protein
MAGYTLCRNYWRMKTCIATMELCVWNWYYTSGNTAVFYHPVLELYSKMCFIITIKVKVLRKYDVFWASNCKCFRHNIKIPTFPRAIALWSCIAFVFPQRFPGIIDQKPCKPGKMPAPSGWFYECGGRTPNPSTCCTVVVYSVLYCCAV